MSHGPWEKLLEITVMIERTKITSPPRQRVFPEGSKGKGIDGQPFR
jgi:hypothetical protein